MPQEEKPQNDMRWIKKYDNIIGTMKPELNSYNRDEYNYRYGTMDTENTCEAYRSAIIYIQLSPKINIKNIEQVLKTTSKHLYDSSQRKYGFYHMLFLNDAQGNLMHDGKPANSWQEAYTIIDKYFSQYATLNYQFSKVITQIFPRIDLYTRERYPSNEDLCVIITDAKGITYDGQFKDIIIKRCNKLVKIVSEDKMEVQVEHIRRID